MKQQIRAECKMKRKALLPEAVSKNSEAICTQILTLPAWKNAKTVLGYSPIQNEVDTKKLLMLAIETGKRCALPITDIEANDLQVVQLTDDSDMQTGAFGISEPKAQIPVPEEEIDVILVPGIAFDKKGGRIGFGKGYYDRLLSRTKAVKIGLCHAVQLVEDTFCEPHDVRMDYVITESELIVCE
ncbi:MAG: 5-formyltetrahydrofolate cyclo-ligase [Ruminococcaceae bacterium]|nr:5-formyltetrahydrofolate cyclo-ligase [Oscillospiraceae bacterium]